MRASSPGPQPGSGGVFLSPALPPGRHTLITPTPPPPLNRNAASACSFYPAPSFLPRRRRIPPPSPILIPPPSEPTPNGQPLSSPRQPPPPPARRPLPPTAPPPPPFLPRPTASLPSHQLHVVCNIFVSPRLFPFQSRAAPPSSPAHPTFCRLRVCSSPPSRNLSQPFASLTPQSNPQQSFANDITFLFSPPPPPPLPPPSQPLVQPCPVDGGTRRGHGRRRGGPRNCRCCFKAF
jgi:hypothetical protein